MKRVLWMTVLLAWLSACTVLPVRPTVALYAPVLELAPASVSASVPWRLALARPIASGPLATPRILVRPSPDEIEIYPRAEWSEPAPGLVGNALMQAFEVNGRIGSLERSSAGLDHDFELTTELRDFQLELAGGPVAVVRIKANLIAQPRGVLVASRLFEARIPAAGQQVTDAVAALSDALAQTLPQVADWTVAEAQAQWRAGDVTAQ
ncbi:ABC-type transport auxiliary lipoprotein family protein [Xanthomonadaceae bacterium JHOS43]|nr:ABC-type transport auxiliary lipoprotein family protein [Xanthomonadaceae bacterium JHOS43]